MSWRSPRATGTRESLVARRTSARHAGTGVELLPLEAVHGAERHRPRDLLASSSAILRDLTTQLSPVSEASIAARCPIESGSGV